MISAKGLQKLGFVPQVDFFLKDDSDGSGTYMEWVSDKPQPSVAEIEAAGDEWVLEYHAEQSAKQDRIASVKSKLEALGLTTEEVQDAFGI